MTITEQVGETTRGFFDVMRQQPLSLALVVMNFLLVAYLFYSGQQTLHQRAQTTDLIVNWQKGTDTLMANCVSQSVTQMMLDNMQKITETMIKTAQSDLTRMQDAIDKERELNRKLIDEQLKRLQRYQPPPGMPFSRNVDQAPNE